MGSFFHDLSTLALLFALNGASTTEQQPKLLTQARSCRCPFAQITQ